LDVVAWDTMADPLAVVTSLTSLNGCDQYSAIRAGGLRELKMTPEWELGGWALLLLERSASTFTLLDFRCALSQPCSAIGATQSTEGRW
jgi:hypothetical protein